MPREKFVFDRRGLDRLKVSLDAAHTKVKVGIANADQAHPGSNGATIGDVAVWQEFGTVKMPENPYFRGTLKDNEKKYAEGLGIAAANVINKGRTKDVAKVGKQAAEDIRRRAPEDTGTLKASIAHQLLPRGEL